MLKFVIVGLIFSTVSAAPLESTSSEKSKNGDSPITHLLIRPSPINPDIPMDPKPPERIILDDSKSERDQRSPSSTIDNDKEPSHGSHENTKSVHNHSDKHSHEDHHDKNSDEDHHEHSDEDSDEHSDEHSDEDSDEHSHEDHHDEKSNKQDSDKQNHDHKHENVMKVPAKSQLPLKQPKELIQPAKSGEPTIVYAIKADEKRSATDNFETSHRIPHIDETERTFETSHHIPSHIEEERTKVVKNAKVEQKTE